MLPRRSYRFRIVEYDRLKRDVIGSTTIKFGEREIDYTTPWPRRRYADLFNEHVGIAIDDDEIDAAVPAEWAASALQPHCAVQGNLDNYLLKVGGAALDRATEQLITVLGRGPFVFNLGHGVLPETPPEHVAQVAERLRALAVAE